MLDKKNAQVTVFIIIGIVIVISIALFIYVNTTRIEEERYPLIIKTEMIPAEFNPIKVYTNKIVKEIAEEAVKQAMKHGGYVYTDRILPNQLYPTEANGFEVASGHAIPYWYYMSEDNHCEKNCNFLGNMIPPLCRGGKGLHKRCSRIRRRAVFN